MTQADSGRARRSSAENSRAELVRAAVAQYEGPLTIYAARLLGDVERAREVVQDTFLKLWTVDHDDVKDHLAQWLYRVCRNRAMDVCRKEVRMTSVDHEKLEQRPDPRVPSGAGGDEPQLGVVMAAIACLSDRQQEVIRLKFQGGLSYQEIANVMNLTANHVGVLIHNALKAVREHMKSRVVDDESPQTVSQSLAVNAASGASQRTPSVGKDVKDFS